VGQWPIRFRLKDYSPVAPQGSLCFSITQLVGQKGHNEAQKLVGQKGHNKANKCKLKEYLFGRKKNERKGHARLRQSCYSRTSGVAN